MENAYRLAAAAVRQRFAEQRPQDLAALGRLTASDVAVYSGSFDHVEEVLKRLGVPYTLNPAVQKMAARVIFVNCSNSYSEALVRALPRCVEAGALLVTSDWGLGRVVQSAFPSTVRWTGRATGDEVVSVEPGLESLWSEVVVLGAEPQWWLEGSSHPIEVLDGERVRVEAASHELLARYGTPVVAVSFDWGRGGVFHVISHFWHRRTRTPTERYRGPGTEFLQAGMRLSGAGIEKVLREARVAATTVNFGALQSAATATELVAQLCARAAPVG
jgi:hypothetical protein